MISFGIFMVLNGFPGLKLQFITLHLQEKYLSVHNILCDFCPEATYVIGVEVACVSNKWDGHSIHLGQKCRRHRSEQVIGM